MISYSLFFFRYVDLIFESLDIGIQMKPTLSNGYMNTDLFTRLDGLLFINSIKIPHLVWFLLVLAIALIVQLTLNIRRLRKELDKKNARLLDYDNNVKNLEKYAQSAIETKQRFLANISHEIRTPLNGLFGLTNQLKKDKLTESQMELITDSEMLIQNLSTLINDVLDYTKLESDKLYLDEINFHLINELTPTLNFYRKKCKEKGISFSAHVGENIPLVLRGDTNRLKQIINNLLSNAFKFTEKGTIILQCELIENSEKTCLLKFTLTDTGKGISEDQKICIWNVFHQGDQENTRDFGGLGLGLSLSKKLVEMMGGSIDFTSEADIGSNFWFTVNLRMGTEPDLLMQNHFNKVLLVEDNIINQKVSMFSLRNQGFEVDVAENGKIAVEKFEKNKYDLILMDIQMPVMDGITATEQIRKIETQRNSRPVFIVALSANSLGNDRKKCVEAGINGFISKPFNLEKMPFVISQLNEKH
ncbi:MAG: hypothetical protein CVT92_13370 [Bacteroidetes bacterium HGW-Bacteroidetes-1]|nr:MAG: hypothetical protein CVT92_13370 [Bacteroidetes bacterium HGW-Bacteroidetes-1]